MGADSPFSTNSVRGSKPWFSADHRDVLLPHPRGAEGLLGLAAVAADRGHLTPGGWRLPAVPGHPPDPRAPAGGGAGGGALHQGHASAAPSLLRLPPQREQAPGPEAMHDSLQV